MNKSPLKLKKRLLIFSLRRRGRKKRLSWRRYKRATCNRTHRSCLHHSRQYWILKMFWGKEASLRKKLMTTSFQSWSPPQASKDNAGIETKVCNNRSLLCAGERTLYLLYIIFYNTRDKINPREKINRFLFKRTIVYLSMFFFTGFLFILDTYVFFLLSIDHDNYTQKVLPYLPQ